MPNKLSVCLAVFNEEANIERALQAVKNLADEIIVVDGESNDETVRLAKKVSPKVKVYSYPNPDNFLLNRQRAMDKATGDWILALDADEIVTPALEKEIKAVLQKPDKVAYNIARLSYFLGQPLKKGGVYPDYCLRFFKRGVGKIPLKTIHDQVEINAKKEDIGCLENDLAHYSYPSFQVYLRKWIQYCDHEADVLERKGIRPSFSLFLRYAVFYPKWWFLKTYFRHKGFRDGFPGFVFSFFSAIRYLAIYTKLYEKQKSR